ncbi:MAG: hydroxyacid dehydrogenase [Armatimonadota bacterium]
MLENNKITFFETDDWSREYLKNCCYSNDVPMIKEPLDEDNAELAKDSEIISVFIYSKVNKEVLDKLPNLKMVTTRSTGFDHIDIKECAKRNIVVSNVPRYGENTVAEHAFALILALSRNLQLAVRNQHRLNFSLEGLRGFDLKGKTLGVVGAGAIGLHSIRMGRGFGMNVVAFDAYPQSILAEVLGFEYVSLDELLSVSDVITLHVPLNEHTHHLINKENIYKIKKGAILVNTSRGGVLETEALVKALDEGILYGAGLDVLEGEETIKEEAQLLSDTMPVEKLRAVVRSYALLHRDNVIITPHIGFYSLEAEQRIINTTVENINAFLSGKPINTILPK